MQGRIDEVTESKHLQMTYIEFLEAVARAAHMLSYPPPTLENKNRYKISAQKKRTPLKQSTSKLLPEVTVENQEEIELFEDMTDDDKIAQPLHRKIENILPNILLYCTSNKFKKSWVWPIKHPKYDLYESKNYKVNEVKKLLSKGITRDFFKKLVINLIM
jgi:hypothetical protein